MKILFLSALDFKKKSIQVIARTPEAYAQRGWRVTYIVGRDTSRRGDYFYEPVFDPVGVEVQRFQWPLRWLRERSSGPVLSVWTKLTALCVVAVLAWKGIRELRRNGPYDVVYGYECHGVLAAALVRAALRMTLQKHRPRFVSRFQGTKLAEATQRRQWLRLAANFDFLAAYWLPCDACIMTNDGTQGRRILRWVGTRSAKVLYYVNGSDPVDHKRAEEPDWQALGVSASDIVVMCVSRLVSWKRLDRSMRACARILESAPTNNQKRSLKLIVIGDGDCRKQYEDLASQLGLAGHVVFTGAVEHSKLDAYYQRADVFFSFYDLSNVGNPLLEAIRNHKVIFTLRNGDTHQWIRHRESGFLFEPDDDVLPAGVAAAFWELIDHPELRARIIAGVCDVERRKLWSWNDRMNAEVDAIEALRAA
jgi:glycosyltransferase involved in cell wall biosynthesis